ncbi:agmatine deiminase family protein [Sphingomonas sp. ERG5]|uniref:agmatine deiminase family protein n=1 Tax=Sphingomonas sp. ERG5 TaxID=1381597 RepID=UPI00054B5586|nr:agmatine deiminase family protein [Sphingomonas sp. ERG5]
MTRRDMIKAGLITLGAGATGCGRAGSATPLHYEMPLESAPHRRTLMQWPVSIGVYGARDLAAVQSTIIAIANAISAHEPVVLLAAYDAPGLDRSRFSRQVEFWDIATDDLWCRDSGPTFVRGTDGGLAVAHLRFNGWGNKQRHANDGLIAPKVAARLGLKLIDSGLVGEQGGVEHDGAGTMLAHVSCWVNRNRNPGQSADQIAARLGTALGARKMIWAPGVKGADITDYHIDSLARFVGPGRVLIQLDDEIDRDDPWSVAAHETLTVLERATDAGGHKLEIVRLPEPVDIRARADDFVSSYINYYVCNGAVIMPQFGDARADAGARDTLAALYPGREIVQLDIDPLGASGGGIHCATQQQPL